MLNKLFLFVFGLNDEEAPAPEGGGGEVGDFFDCGSGGHLCGSGGGRF